MAHNEYLNSVWVKHLQKLEYPHCEFISSDKMMSVSRFAQLKGAVLLSAYAEYKDQYSQPALEILNKACELGLYSALIQRLEFYNKFIATHINDDKYQETIDSYVQYMLRDILTLTRLYGSMAHIDSAFILFKLASTFLQREEQKLNMNYFFMSSATNKFSWITMYNTKEVPLPVTLLSASLEHLFKAELLENDPISKRASQHILRSDNLLSGFDDTISDPVQLKAQVKQKLNQIGIPLVDSLLDMALDTAKESCVALN
jgi:hypothetical protein